MDSPSCGRGWKSKGGLGQPSPTVGTKGCVHHDLDSSPLVLLSHCTGSLSQPVLTQLLFLSTCPGTSARLTCTLRSDVSVGSKDIFWYQQKPGTPPPCLLYYHTDSDKHQGSRSPAASLDPKMPQPMQDFCSSLGSSLRTRLTIRVQSGTVRFLTVTQANGKWDKNLSLLRHLG
uniref:Immunoglobulin V-set domain-containing protein n=1 Tax=Equus caballus TaxID=9796 RepID=A0A9L0R6K4_HORSE